MKATPNNWRWPWTPTSFSWIRLPGFDEYQFLPPQGHAQPLKFFCVVFFLFSLAHVLEWRRHISQTPDCSSSCSRNSSTMCDHRGSVSQNLVVCFHYASVSTLLISSSGYTVRFGRTHQCQHTQMSPLSAFSKLMDWDFLRIPCCLLESRCNVDQHQVDIDGGNLFLDCLKAH